MPSPPVSRLFLTGAAGLVGTALRPLLRERCEELILSDIAPVEDLGEKETFHRVDLADLDGLVHAAEGVDAIVHLGGLVGPHFTFDQVLGANIVGTRNVFEAALRKRIPRVVYASSHHAVGFFQRGDRVDHTTAPLPDSFYGLSKAFGEEAGAYYAHKHGLRVLAIRIGFVGESVIDERRLHTWSSPRDLAQLIEIGLTHPEIGFEIVYGVSDNPEPFFDNTNAFRLGYRPQDRSIDHLADEGLLDQKPDPETPAGKYIGGHFAE